MLACKHVAKSYGGRKILSDVSLRIEPGECVCIASESGSGKTTLLKLLCGLEAADAGGVEVDNVPIGALPLPVLQLYRSRLGIIFQEPRLLEHATVYENVALPLDMRRTNPLVTKRKVNELLKAFDLVTKADLLPRELSAGERACVGIARAFIASPLIVLADEPFGLLDSTQSAVLFSLLEDARRRGASVVLLSREAGIGRKLGARLLRLREGKMALAATEAAPAMPEPVIAETAAPQVVPTEEHTDSEQIVPVSARPRAVHKAKKVEKIPGEPTEKPNKKIRITSIGS
jgi:cell division transport system ATP-binding protein